MGQSGVPYSKSKIINLNEKKNTPFTSYDESSTTTTTLNIDVNLYKIKVGFDKFSKSFNNLSEGTTEEISEFKDTIKKINVDYIITQLIHDGNVNDYYKHNNYELVKKLSIQNIELPRNMEVIYPYMMQNFENLVKIEIPKTVIQIKIELLLIVKC